MSGTSARSSVSETAPARSSRGGETVQSTIVDGSGSAETPPSR